MKDNMDKRERLMRLKQAYLQRDTQLNESIEKSYKKVHHYADEAIRISNTLDNVEQIVDDLDREFSKRTALNLQDMGFLFFAIAIQTIGWIFSPNLETEFKQISKEDRHSAGEDGRWEFSEGAKFAAENQSEVIHSKKYPDKIKMFSLAVPYDVMEGTKSVKISGISDVGKNLYGGNHHVATLGHDPILGYVFGTINILSRTVTFKTPTLQTNLVRLKHGTTKGQYMGPEIGFLEALQRAIESASEDATRVPAAILRQHLHMQSDKFTKQGLPIPLIDAERAQDLLEQGWNSNELERLISFVGKDIVAVGAQATIRSFLNVVIESMHTFLYDERREKNFKLYQAKTKKILMYSNIIASSSNVIYSSLCKDKSKLDVGGILVTIHRIMNDKEFIRKVKEEFVYGQYRDMLNVREYPGEL